MMFVFLLALYKTIKHTSKIEQNVCYLYFDNYEICVECNQQNILELHHMWRNEEAWLEVKGDVQR